MAVSKRRAWGACVIAYLSRRARHHRGEGHTRRDGFRQNIEQLVGEGTGGCWRARAGALARRRRAAKARARDGSRSPAAARAGASAREIGQFIDALHAEDPSSSWRASAGTSGLGDLMGRYRATVISAARTAAGGELGPKSWRSRCGPNSTGCALAPTATPAASSPYYSGCGSLGGWLRAVVSQLGVDRHRRSSRLVQTEEDADFDRLFDETRAGATASAPRQRPTRSAPSPSRSGGGVVEGALAQAVSELADEDRLLVSSTTSTACD